MPLIKGKSKHAFEHNIKAEMEAGKPQKQSLAIAYSMKRKAAKKKMAMGGSADEGPAEKANKDIKGVHEIMPTYEMKRGVRHGSSPAGARVDAANVLGKHSEGYKEAQLSKAKQEHRTKLEELRAMPKPKLQGLAEGGLIAALKENTAAMHKSRNTSGLKIHPFERDMAQSAVDEKRPMPDQTTNSGKMASQQEDKKTEMLSAANESRPMPKKGMQTQKIKHPKMVKSDVLQVRLRDEEDDLQSSAATNEGPQRQPPEVDNEEGADRQGPTPPKQPLHTKNLNKYAKGGMAEDADHSGNIHNKAVDDEYGGEVEEDMQVEPKGLQEDDDQEGQSMEKIYSDEPMLAEGGIAEEAEEEHHDSIAAAIMARRDRMKAEVDSGAHDEDLAARYADGGEVDLDLNATEQPNEYPPMNGDALEWDEDSEAIHSKDQPMDSNMHGDDIPADENDMVSSIRRKLKAKRSFSEM